MSRSVAFALTEMRSAYRPQPFVTKAGKFNLGRIMQEAVSTARQLRAGGSTWAWRMRIGLRTAWARAKAEMALTQRPAARPAVTAAPTPRTVLKPRPAGRTWDRPIRLRLHGW